MTVFMTAGELMGTVDRLRSEMRNKRDYGKAGKADDEYLATIAMLESCLSTNEATTEQRNRIEQVVDEFYQHVGLGIILNGAFRPIPPSQAARWDITKGSTVSANRFPVVTERMAKEILERPASIRQYHDTWSWDAETNSLVTLPFWYRRHLDHLPELTRDLAIQYGLFDLWLEQMEVDRRALRVPVEQWDI
jgi:hypothetical protein